MASSKRPFFRYSIYQLETIVENRQPHEDMSDIIYELSFRRTSRAKSLLRKLSNGEYKKEIKKTLQSKITNQSQSNQFNEKPPKVKESSSNDFILLIIILLVGPFIIDRLLI